MSRTLVIAALAVMPWLAAAPTWAKDRPSLRPPVVDALRIDGRLDDAAWADALTLPVAPVTVPDATVDAGTRTTVPQLRAVVHQGQLCLGVTCDEPPGTGCGLLVFVAPSDATTVEAASSLSFRPLNPRADRMLVRAVGGVGLAHCPMTGAVDTSQESKWTLELRVPLASLGASTGALRLAVAVCTRTPTQVASSPAEAAWMGPADWFVLDAPSGGWTTAGLPSEAEIKALERTEGERRHAWDTFLLQSHREVVGTTTEDEALWKSLHAVATLRPELLPVVETIAGDMYERVGDLKAAQSAYDKALVAAPGWTEARLGRDVRLRARTWLRMPTADGAPTDFDVALQRITAARDKTKPWRMLGCDFAEGLLLSRRGEYLKARPILARVAARFPGDEWIQKSLERARSNVEPVMFESQRRKKDAKATLPRVKITTSRGDIVVELFEKHLPNAVNQFVWLVEHGFYDGTAVHHTVGYSHAAMGDPYSKAASSEDEALVKRVGSGGPGYAIRVRESDRPPFRGAIAFPLASRDVRAAGSQFVLITGNAVEENTLAAFGVIVEGQAVADALRTRDRILSTTVLRKTEGWSYHPIAVDGKQAPKPK